MLAAIQSYFGEGAVLLMVTASVCWQSAVCGGNIVKKAPPAQAAARAAAEGNLSQ